MGAFAERIAEKAGGNNGSVKERKKNSFLGRVFGR